MEIVLAERGAGKSTALVKESAETGLYILVATRRRAEELIHIAKRLELNIPFPVTVGEYLDSRFRGSCIRRDGLLIDNAEDVLQQLLMGIPIKKITITKNNNVVDLSN